MEYKPQHSIKLAPGFEKINEEIANSKKNLEHLQNCDKEAQEKNTLLHRYFHVPVADGMAYYQVTKVTARTATVKRCEGICLDEYADGMLGDGCTLPIAMVKQQVKAVETLNKLFGTKK
jgi:hypothetical protein